LHAYARGSENTDGGPGRAAIKRAALISPNYGKEAVGPDGRKMGAQIKRNIQI